MITNRCPDIFIFNKAFAKFGGIARKITAIKFFFSKVQTWRSVILLKLVVSQEFSKIFVAPSKLISGQCSYFIPPETLEN